LPAETSGFSADIAVKFRSNWPTEIDTEPPDEALALLLAPAPEPDVEDDELHAAAARHKASDTDATAAPFLATGIMKTTSRLKGTAVSQACVITSLSW
jgi:hypothetical protein